MTEMRFLAPRRTMERNPCHMTLGLVLQEHRPRHRRVVPLARVMHALEACGIELKNPGGRSGERGLALLAPGRNRKCAFGNEDAVGIFMEDHHALSPSAMCSLVHIEIQVEVAEQFGRDGLPQAAGDGMAFVESLLFAWQLVRRWDSRRR